MKQFNLVDHNIFVKRSREIVVNDEINCMQELIDFVSEYTLMAKSELEDGKISGDSKMFILADYHLECLAEINKCMAKLQQKISGLNPEGLIYSWGLNK
jgi:hypothetical protein